MPQTSTAPASRVDPPLAMGADAGASPSSPFMRALPGITLAALRVVSALVLLEHSTQRVFGFPAPQGRPWGGAPEMFTRPWFASALEITGGILLILGLFTRPVAFVLSGLMAFAYFLVHAPRGFFPISNGGEPAVLLCFVLLYISTVGAGPFSLDAVLRRGRSV